MSIPSPIEYVYLKELPEECNLSIIYTINNDHYNIIKNSNKYLKILLIIKS